MIAAAQSIFTVAGGGTTNGRPATSLFLRGVGGFAFDASGNVFFSEPQRNVVHRLDVTTGILTIYAGNGGGSFAGDNGPATRASLKDPWGLAVDDDGNLFIADRENHRIRRVDAKTGVITTFAGVGDDGSEPPLGDGGAATSARIYGPIGVAWRNGNLYITQAGFNHHRVRRVTPDGKIATIAGTGPQGFSGDGGLATAAQLNDPFGIAVDAGGNVYIADTSNDRIRRVDAVTGNIETVVGGGTPSDPKADGPGTSVRLNGPSSVAFDPGGRLIIADAEHSLIRRYDVQSKAVTRIAGNDEYDSDDGLPALQTSMYRPFAIGVDKSGAIYVHINSVQSIRRIDPATSIVQTIAGKGTFVGDGLVATSAILSQPRGLAVDKQGNLFISDPGHTLVRRVDAKTKVISTFAGQLNTFYGAESGVDVKDSIVGGVSDVAFNAAGELFIVNPHSEKVFKVDAAGKYVLYAGGGSPADFVGDNGPATSAQISPDGIAVDSAGNLYIVDRDAYSQPTRHRVRRVDAATKLITTVAGGATSGFAGDGGPATAALLDSPDDVAVDAAGNVFISDLGNGAIRRIDAASGNISTYAGRGNPADGFGDGLVATEAVLQPRAIEIDPRTGDLYVADNNGHSIRRIDAKSRIIRTVAGSGKADTPGDFIGDNGKATEARLNFQYDTSGLAFDSAGNLFISDTQNDRVRVVYACATVNAPQLNAPSDAATGVSAPSLSWAASPGAFRYDVYLDTVADPQRVVAADVDALAFTPSNLLPNTKYYWKVRAKGDPFCEPVSTATSAVRSFTTTGRCAAGPFDLISPADGATNVNSTILLSWQASAGAGQYDVYFGNVNPPPFHASTTGTSLQVSARTGVHYWTVVARAACDPLQTASTQVRSFTPTPPPSCVGGADVTLLSPDNGATGTGTSLTLTWRASGCATAPFDVYLGTDSDPPLFATNVSATSQRVEALLPGTTYRWKIVARNLNGGAVSSRVATFTTGICAAPEKTSITFAPAVVGSGSTYTLLWSPAAGLDPDGGYLVERSTSPSFATIESSQVTLSTAASFIAGRAGTAYHRVRPLPSCDPTKMGPASDVRQVTITAARPNVVFTVQPVAVVVALGEHLEERSGSFTLENIGDTPAIVAVGRTELGNSPPFFSIVDPLGNDVFVTLEPRKPRTFGIRYSGPRTDVSGSYQGVIQVAGAGLSVVPYAFVELRVGAAGSSRPRFIVNGVPSDYLALPGREGTTDTTVSIGIRNDGTAPMEMAAEIGPEVWIVPERGWNDARVEPGTTRTVNLNTRRLFAPQGSSLPRYTYLTVRTRDGGSARLLIQDNDDVRSARGRTRVLDASEHSLILPEVTTTQAANGSIVASRVRLTNAGSDSVQAELIFTPAATDGFDQTNVRRAVVVVPPNDVVTLIDPLVQIFKLSRPASGQLEVRLPAERVGLLSVTGSTQGTDGTAAVVIPTIPRGAGARVSAPHAVFGATQTTATTTSLILAETSGLEAATVRVTLFNPAGTRVGEKSYEVPRYGYVRADDIVNALGGSTIEHGQLTLSVTSGGGSVIGVALLRDRESGSAATFVSEPSGSTNPASAHFLRALTRTPGTTLDGPPVTIVVPILPNSSSAGASPSYRTMLAFSATASSPATFKAVLKSLSGEQLAATPSFGVAVGTSVIFKDATKDLFQITAPGTIFIEGSDGGKVSAVLQTVRGSAVAPSASIPLVTNASELLSSAMLLQRPLFFDGLEQSVDPARGTRWLLTVNEVSGGTGTLRVMLYEAGNRTSPIAQRDLGIAAYQQLTLDTVFAALGLESPERRKDRTNVQVAVMAIGGAARIAASAVSIDNQTGDTKLFALAPTVGSSNPGHSLASVVTPPAAPQKPRRRSVRH